jgi:hypothetical protein
MFARYSCIARGRSCLSKYLRRIYGTREELEKTINLRFAMRRAQVKGVGQPAKGFLLRAAVRGTTRKCRGIAEESLSFALPRRNCRKLLTCLRKESEGNCSRKGFFRGFETLARGAKTWGVVPRPFHGRVGEFCPQIYPLREDINSFRGHMHRWFATTASRDDVGARAGCDDKPRHPPPIRRSAPARLTHPPRIPRPTRARLVGAPALLASPRACCVAPATDRQIPRRCTSDVTDSPAMM